MYHGRDSGYSCRGWPAHGRWNVTTCSGCEDRGSNHARRMRSSSSYTMFPCNINNGETMSDGDYPIFSTSCARGVTGLAASKGTTACAPKVASED